MVHAVILALEHSFPSGILLVHDLLRMAEFARAKEDPPLFDVKIVSEHGKTLTYSGFCDIRPQRPVAEVGRVDLVIVPSGGYRVNALGGYSEGLTQWVGNQYRKGADMAGICTGVFLLAESGILSGKKATTHWAYEDLFRTNYPDVDLRTDELITEDDRVFCSGGGSAGVDLSLYMIEKYYGPEPARRCAAMMLLDRGRHAQTPYRDTPLRKKHSDEEILKAQAFIEHHISGGFVMDDVASHVGMSLRNFKRRFKIATGESPLVYLQRLRMEQAKHVLERDDTRIEDLAVRVGYDDLGFFRKLFMRYTGVSPSDYRQRFRSRFDDIGARTG